jgi:hypothetical protein
MMAEYFIQPDDPEQSNDSTLAAVSDELHSIEHGREVVYGVAGCIDAEVINYSLDMLQQELGRDGSVRKRIEELESKVIATEHRLAIAESKQREIELCMRRPQLARDWAAQALDDISKRQTKIAQQIQNLQKQKSSTENRNKINDLQNERQYSDARLHQEAWSVQINADAHLNSLNTALEYVITAKSFYQEQLAGYQNEIRVLGDRLAKVSAGLGSLVAEMTNINALASNPYRAEEMLSLEATPDIDVDIEIDTRPVSYGEHPLFGENKVSYVEVSEHPANILEFADVASVEITVETTSAEEVEQPYSLEPILRAKATEAQSTPRLSKKAGRINNFLKSKKIRV